MSEVPLNIQKRRTVLDFIIQQPLGFIGLIMIIIMFTAAIFAPHVAPFNPEDVDFEASPALGGGQPSWEHLLGCLLYTSPSPRDRQKSRMPSSA